MLDDVSKLSLVVSVFSAYLAIFRTAEEQSKTQVRKSLKTENNDQLGVTANLVSENRTLNSSPQNTDVRWFGIEKYNLYRNFGLELFEELENAGTVDKQINHLIQKHYHTRLDSHALEMHGIPESGILTTQKSVQ